MGAVLGFFRRPMWHVRTRPTKCIRRSRKFRGLPKSSLRLVPPPETRGQSIFHHSEFSEMEFEDIRHKWGWLLLLGIGTIVLGVVALAIIPVTTLATVLVLGWILALSGILEAVHGFQVRSSHSLFLHLIGGVL